MKKLFKGFLPKRMLAVVQKTYWRLVNRPRNVVFAEKELDTLRFMVAYNKYGGYCIPLSSRHRPAAKKLLAHEVYEPKTIEFLLSNCANGDVIHAGTYFGDFLPALSKGVSPGSKIWAFEPNKENYRCANITIAINGAENIVLTNAALGSKQEQMFIKTTDSNGRSLGGSSRIVPKESDGEFGAEAVPIVAIDKMVEPDRNIGIIQLDVEGHEKEALIGALLTIKRCLPIIVIEVLPQSTLIESDWFSENILSLGYRKIGDVHGNSIFSCGA